MFIKRFVAPTMAQATELVRKEMGTDAIILSSHAGRATGISGFLGKRTYELVAAIEEMSESRSSPMGTTDRASLPSSLQKWHAGVDRIPEVQQEPGLIMPPLQKSPVDADSAPLESQLQEIRSMLSTAMYIGALHAPANDAKLVALAKAWSDTSLSTSLFERFLAEHYAPARVLNDRVAIDDVARTFVKRVLVSHEPNRVMTTADRIVVFVGPTGVGKTTTIAKLAARAMMTEGRKVGLLSLDTYRIGAVAQLRTYAEILNIPFVAAGTIDEAKSALDQLSGCDLILTDTTGRSYFDASQVTALKRLLSPLSIDLTYLVLSLTMRQAEASEISRFLSVIGYDALLFTKNDEALRPTLALTMMDELNKPLSYIGTGQEVPHHLHVADSEWLSDLLIGGGSYDRSSRTSS